MGPASNLWQALKQAGFEEVFSEDTYKNYKEARKLNAERPGEDEKALMDDFEEKAFVPGGTSFCLPAKKMHSNCPREHWHKVWKKAPKGAEPKEEGEKGEEREGEGER